MGKLALQDLRILIWWQINPEWCRGKDKLILVTRYPLKTLFLATQAQVQDWQWTKGEAWRLTTNMMYFHWCMFAVHLLPSMFETNHQMIPMLSVRLTMIEGWSPRVNIVLLWFSNIHCSPQLQLFVMLHAHHKDVVVMDTQRRGR